MREQIFRRAAAADLLECRARILQIREDEFFRQRTAVRERGATGSRERIVRARHQHDMPRVRDLRTISMRIRERIQQVGFVVVILLMVFVITNDILKQVSISRGGGGNTPAASPAPTK